MRFDVGKRSYRTNHRINLFIHFKLIINSDAQVFDTGSHIWFELSEGAPHKVKLEKIVKDWNPFLRGKKRIISCPLEVTSICNLNLNPDKHEQTTVFPDNCGFGSQMAAAG